MMMPWEYKAYAISAADNLPWPALDSRLHVPVVAYRGTAAHMYVGAICRICSIWMPVPLAALLLIAC